VALCRHKVPLYHNKEALYGNKEALFFAKVPLYAAKAMNNPKSFCTFAPFYFKRQ
jgi:hypothetical protein